MLPVEVISTAFLNVDLAQSWRLLSISFIGNEVLYCHSSLMKPMCIPFVHSQLYACLSHSYYKQWQQLQQAYQGEETDDDSIFLFTLGKFA